MTRVDDAAQVETRVLARYHLRFGWFSLLVFLSLGIALETLHDAAFLVDDPEGVLPESILEAIYRQRSDRRVDLAE